MSAKAEADSTTQKPEKVEPKKLSPSKQRRKEDRDLKFNKTVTDTSISDNSSQLEDPDLTLDRVTNPVTHQVITSVQDPTEAQVQDDNMSDKISCDKFVYSGDQNTLGTRWTTWSEIFDLYVTANGLTDNGKIKASYLILMGREAYEMYKTKKKPDDTDTLAEIKAFMKAQFVAKKSEYTEIITFRRAFKLEGESVSDYAMRLRRLATDCNYGQTLEKEIERQFVVGCNMEEVQRKCCRTDGLDLKQALEIATGFERVNENLNNLRTPTAYNRHHHSINHIVQKRKSNDDRRLNSNESLESLCSYCNREAHDDRFSCPARGLSCLRCGKMNHFAAACRADDKTAALFKNNNQGNNRSSTRNKSPNSSFRNKPEQTSSQSKQIANVSTGENVQQTTLASRQLNQAEYDEYLRYKRLTDYGLNTFAINSHPSYKSRFESGPTASATVLAQSIAFLVDTGAPVNILNESTFSRIKGKTILDKSTKPIYGYGATKPLEILGQFCSTIQYENRILNTTFFVIKGHERCLMSYQTARTLGVILIDEGPSVTTALLRSKPTNIPSSAVSIQIASAEHKQNSNFVETGVELDAADKRKVSSSENAKGNAIATQPVEPPPTTTPAPTAKLERTTKQQAAIAEQSRMRLEHERLANNPPLSAPSRLANQNPRGGKM
jgi:hypothetical protein